MPIFIPRVAARHPEGRAVAIAALLLAAPSFAFDSFTRPFEEIQRDPVIRAQVRRDIAAGRTSGYAGHYDITKVCLSRSGVLDDAAEQLSKTTSEIDFVAWNNPKRDYEPKRHCDRRRDVQDSVAFSACLGYFRHYIGEAWYALSTLNIPVFKKALPRALHTQQDFFSHSNYVDLAPSDMQESVRACWVSLPDLPPSDSLEENQSTLWHAELCTAPAPHWLPEIKLTGYDRRERDPYASRGDAYSHREFAKDNPSYGPEARKKLESGKTKYEVARDAAIEACVETVERFKVLCRGNASCQRRYKEVFRD